MHQGKLYSKLVIVAMSQWLFGLKKIISTIDAPPGVPVVSKNHIYFFTDETVFLLC